MSPGRSHSSTRIYVSLPTVAYEDVTLGPKLCSFITALAYIAIRFGIKELSGAGRRRDGTNTAALHKGKQQIFTEIRENWELSD